MTDPSRLTLDEKLRADLGAEAGALSPTLSRLESLSAPEPSSSETARLLTALKPELLARSTPRFRRPGGAWVLLLIGAQVRLIHQQLWLASALVLAIGVFVTVALQGVQHAPGILPLVFVAPIVTAFGVACLYGPGAGLALEVELAAPVSPRLILLARLALVFGFNLALSLAASVLVSAFVPPVSLVALILAWLAPMTFLSALAFLLSVLCFDPMAGVTASIMLWAVQIFKAIGGFDGWPLVAGWPDLFTAGARPWLLGFALALVLAGLWAAGRDERWARPAV